MWRRLGVFSYLIQDEIQGRTGMFRRSCRILKVLTAIVVMNPISSAATAVDEHYATACRALGNVHPMGGATAIAALDTVLDGHEDFNHNNDKDICRSTQVGLLLRKAVFGLTAPAFQAVVNRHEAFFRTSLGMSLIHGWMLRQFESVVTPYYTGAYFSFNKFFQGMASKMAGDAKSMDIIIAGSRSSLAEARRGRGLGDNVRQPSGNALVDLLRQACDRGLAAVEANRWKYYNHMLYLPYAIEQVHSDRKGFLIEALSAGMKPEQKSLVALALADVPKHEYTSEFFNACKALSTRMNGTETARVIRGVSEIAEDQYQGFTNICQRVSEGMDLYDRSQIVRIAAKVPVAAHQTIDACFGQISTGMDSKTKIQLLGILASVPADKHTPTFAQECIRLSAGKRGNERFPVVRDYAREVRYLL